MWFLSQQITVTLILLAASLAVTRRPAWLSGAALALAVVARPHILVIAPLLVGIWWQNTRAKTGRNGGLEESWWAGGWRWASRLRWRGRAAVLQLAALRQRAGLRLPDRECGRFYGRRPEELRHISPALHPAQPAGDVPQPAAVESDLRRAGAERGGTEHADRLTGAGVPGGGAARAKGRRQPWMLGAWAAILCVLIPLVLYYNTGAWQFGYKYLLDFLVPVVMLLAVAAGDRISRGTALQEPTTRQKFPRGMML